jgi:hypothetical protein
MARYLLELELPGKSPDPELLQPLLSFILANGLSTLQTAAAWSLSVPPGMEQLPRKLRLLGLYRDLSTANYPLADRPDTPEVYRLFQVDRLADLPRGWQNQIRAIPTGTWRLPRAGEWYLSGAIVEAYCARPDLDTPYQIARLVRTRALPVTVLEPPDPEEP